MHHRRRQRLPSNAFLALDYLPFALGSMSKHTGTTESGSQAAGQEEFRRSAFDSERVWMAFVQAENASRPAAAWLLQSGAAAAAAWPAQRLSGKPCDPTLCLLPP